MGRRLRALFVRPHKQLKKILPSLSALEAGLDKVRLRIDEDPLSALLDLFNLTSSWHDRGIKNVIVTFESVNYGQHADMLSALRFVQWHIEKTGRDMYGHNRTRRGERPTVDNVFLGNIFGLSTQPISYWRKRQGEPKGGWGLSTTEMRNMSPYDVVVRQAKEFLYDHIPGMQIRIRKVIVMTKR